MHVGTFMCILVKQRLWEKKGTAASFCLSAAMFGNKIRELKQKGDGDAIQLGGGTYECPI